jgi:hypothetical protein
MARVIAAQRVKQLSGKVSYSPPEDSDEWNELVDDLIDSIWAHGSQPFLIKWL